MFDMPQFRLRTALAAGVALSALSFGLPALAVEGVVQYPHGAEDFMSGAVPPPGTYYVGYGVHYRGALQDSKGHTVKAGGQDIELTVSGLANRFIHVTDTKILGANLGFHAIIPLLSNKIGMVSGSETRTGLGDITFAPLLAWHTPNLHWVAAVDINAPTGSYKKNRMINLGANYWSFEPLVAVTWLPGDDWDISAKLMYNIKTENNDTNYRSGNEFHADFAVGKSFGNWKVGINGYYVRQVEDDELNGRNIDNRSHVFAAGPAVSYQADKINFIAKWQHEFMSENAFQGERFFVKAVIPF